MKVSELIDRLKEQPQDAMVVIDGYEGGVWEADSVKIVKIKTDVNSEWYYGDHEIAEDGDVVAVHINA